MVELAIVIVIVTILAGVAIPRYLTMISESRVRTSGEQTARAMRFARQMAVTLRRNVTVAAVPGSSRLSVVNAANGDTLYHFGLPGGATVLSATGTPTFFPRGTSLGATVVVGDCNGARQVVVNVVSRVRVAEYTP